MPNIDISRPKGKIEGPDVEMEGGIGGKFKMPHMKMPDIDISLPMGKIEGPDVEMEGGTGGKFKMPHMQMPNIDISLPKGKIEGPDVEMEGSTGGKFKMPHMKMPNIDISLPKGKIEGPETEIQVEGGKFKMPHFNMPSVDASLPKGKIEGPNIEMEGGTGGKFKMPNIDISLPKGKIDGPDVEMEGRTGGKFKMPHMKMPNIDISLPKGKIEGPDVEMEGRTGGKFKMPHMKLPNIDISLPKGKIEGPDVEMEGSTGGKFKMPHMKMPNIDISLPKGKIEGPETEIQVEGLFDVSLKGEGSSSSLNCEKAASPHKGSTDNKGTFSGKIKVPKVELTSPYGKMAAEGDDMEISVKSGKVEDTKGLKVISDMTAFAGFSEDLSKDVVSSHARTDMLDRDSSESPASSTMEFSSAKVKTWSKVESQSRESEERESSTWFKVPKFTLKPHSTGFLQITPEGSPQALRKGEVGGEADVLGSFCLNTPGLHSTTQKMSEEHHVSSAQEGTLTMVTKTTRITQHTVTTETQAGESSATTTTTHKVGCESNELSVILLAERTRGYCAVQADWMDVAALIPLKDAPQPEEGLTRIRLTRWLEIWIFQVGYGCFKTVETVQEAVKL
ncbi:Neuroblast differentiation-associated protein AHNAK [Liparis tanakae]|uniref:Neuroblast differentiation-associated protein AHNAK n=1 Tax=Liparis tanakae TaxID=230148 RepID=A0A4Z2HLN1_9TELE|nr:Neuroblast differentiation-associated protein AHNAK [Liparis tanakae]